jgi:Ser/Thr protein kinase RdoA (MazF antagonist)
VVLAASRRRGCFWYSTLGSLNREEALDALAWLRASKRSDRAMQSMAVSLARTIRCFHEAGGHHGDLHLANLLIDDSRAAPRCWLVDLDRTTLHASVSPRARMNELMRLLRSVEKTNHHKCLQPRIRAAFLSAYCQGDRSLRKRLLDCIPREERRLRRHRLGWRLGLAVSTNDRIR